MLVSLQLLRDAIVTLNVTVLDPWLAPKFNPVIVTEVLTGPDAGDRNEMTGVGITVKKAPLLVRPLTVTTTLPVGAPGGTGTEMLVALQLVGEAVVPLNVTVLDPWLEPKLVPVIVTELANGPEVGDRPVMLGPDMPPEVALMAPSMLLYAPAGLMVILTAKKDDTFRAYAAASPSLGTGLFMSFDRTVLGSAPTSCQRQ